MADSRTHPDNFALIIGAMKSGTTSLFQILSQHPEIAPAREKEPRYFADDAVMQRGWEWYLNLWDWDPARHKVALEASTAYSNAPGQPGVPGRIAEINNAKFRFIYILRNPLDRIASNARHGMYAGWGRSLDDGVADYLINLTRYAMQIDQYLAHFPRDSLLLLTLEEFQETPESVLARICAFLGVADDFKFRAPGERYNTSDLYQVAPFWAKLLKARSVRFLAHRFIPHHLRHELRKRLKHLPRRKAPLGRCELTEENKSYILEQLATDLHRLESTYGIDIGRYWSLRVSQPSSGPRITQLGRSGDTVRGTRTSEV